MIKNIIFDFDGVIHDTFELGYSISKILDSKIDESKYRSLFAGNLYAHKKVTDKTSADFFKIAEEKYKGLKIEKAIRDEIIKLKGRFNLFIISSNKEKILHNYFHENSLHNIFTEVLGMETHKSKKIKFDMLIKKHKLEKEECVFITDTLGDILEANEIGIKTIAVDFGFHHKALLEKGNPHIIISDFMHIEKEIKNIY